MRVVDTFLEPILKEALRKTKDKEWLRKEIQDDETLLDHLVRFTSGESCVEDTESETHIYFLLIQILSYFMTRSST